MKATCLTILVVDDDHDIADTVAMLLELHGHRAFVAYDGATGAAMGGELHPELALLDINMLGMDGYETARALRASLDGNIFLAAQTAVCGPDAQRRAQEAGFDRFLIKPIKLEELLSVVQDALAKPSQ